MLDLTEKHEAELQERFADITFDEHFMFLYGASWRNKYKSSESSWEKHEFVSVDKGHVVGYLSYKIDRCSNLAYCMQAVNFFPQSITFSRDFKQFLTDIFEKFRFRKLKFSCYAGNPAEKMYNKNIQRYGGRIVGIEKEEGPLMDGKYYDLIDYEILRTNYIKAVTT